MSECNESVCGRADLYMELLHYELTTWLAITCIGQVDGECMLMCVCVLLCVRARARVCVCVLVCMHAYMRINEYSVSARALLRVT